MIFGDGSVYAGRLLNDLPHGEGDFEYVNKDKYIGQFYEGKKDGDGSYYFSEGTVYVGKWRND